jgi:glycerate-2-kinase
VHVIAAGKAARAMAAAVSGMAAERLRGGMLVSTGPAPKIPKLETLIGGHPVPTDDSERAGRLALDVAARAASGDRLLVLLSGGASALMAVPANGITLRDKQSTTDQLLRGGADIHALNTVRKHLSAIKGGWLAAKASSPPLTLAVSDVVGDDPSVIGSGPTVGDPSTFGEAVAVLRRFGDEARYPPAVMSYLMEGTRGERPETPKPGDPRLAGAGTRVIGSRHDAMRGAALEAEARGYHTVILEEAVVGEARVAARRHLESVAAHTAGAERPLCVISSGETTVRVTGSGRGGRNQEFALAAADLLPSLGVAAAASAGTDGVDGPTDAAGGIVDTSTMERARAAGLGSTAPFLDNNNSYAFFATLGDLINTGPTGTNVGDLQIFLIGPSA